MQTVDPTKSTVTLTKSTVAADESVSVKVSLVSASGEPLRQTVTLEASGTGNTVSGPDQTGKDGLAEMNFRSTVAEKKTLTVSSGGVSLAPVELTVVPGPLQVIRFTTQPTTTRVGQVIRPAVAIGATDSLGNVVITSDLMVSVRLVRSTGGVVSNGAAKAFADGGVVFDTLTIDRAQTGYALRAEGNNGAAVESALFDVTP